MSDESLPYEKINMLRISSKQFSTLDAISTQKFVDDAVQHLFERCHQEANMLGEARLRETITEMIFCSSGFGVVLKEDILNFIEVELRNGPRFFEHCGWAQHILHQPHLCGTYKVDQLIEAEIFVNNSGDPDVK